MAFTREEWAAPAAREAAVAEDLSRILAAAGLPPGSVLLERAPRPAEGDEVEVRPVPGGVRLVVRAGEAEWGPAAYFGLRRLGFLFPHPRRQLSPTLDALRAVPAGRHPWRPRLRRRGFHLHTQHPSEWVDGFLGEAPAVAEDLVRWSARNGQNLLQLVGLRTVPDLPERLNSSFALARRLGISTGLSVSLASIQQKSLRLLDWPLPALPAAALFPAAARRRAAARAGELAERGAFDYLVLELGSSEFTPTPRGATLAAIEAVRAALARKGRGLFVKIHCSSNQGKGRENYNFLPRLCRPEVGVLPHTVMIYGLEGPAPVYGRADFSDMREFQREEARRRPVWHFPETSYFIGTDIDIPLFLTDYLAARARDLDILEEDGVDGQVVFTTGQELGYWLFDWTAALLSCGEPGGALAGLRLLGEDEAVWRPILDFQTRHVRGAGLHAALSASNFMDELPFLPPGHRVLARRLLSELEADPAARAEEERALARAEAELPPLAGVRDEELRLVLEVTWGRLRHALALRRALGAGRGSPVRRARLKEAAAIRREAARGAAAAAALGRYPEARVFSRGRNPTSYSYGYGWPAARLFFWEREEELVGRGVRNPFFRSLYRPLDILL